MSSLLSSLSSPRERAAATRPIRVVCLLEANSITGPAKAILEFARQAVGELQLSIVNLTRRDMANDNPLTAAMDAERIPFTWIEERRRFDPKTLYQLTSVIASTNADVIWSNSVKSHFLVRAAGLHKSRAWVAFHHGYTHTDFKMRIYNQLDRWSLRAAHRVLTVCRAFANDLARQGVDKERIRIQHMPIRPFSYSAATNAGASLRAKLKLSDEVCVILSVGRLSREKAHRDLIGAFASVSRGQVSRQFALVIVGDGPELGNLRRLTETLAVEDSVIFAGHQIDVTPFYGMANVFALPSHTEGSPNVLLEAAAARLPIVATNVGGIPELVEDGRDALLVPPGDVRALAAALSNVTENKHFAETIADSAARVVQRHTPRAFFENVALVLTEAINSVPWFDTPLRSS